jgi:hypothetical protein
MADNVGYTPGSGALVASREVAYSGDTAKMQVVGLATLDGPDDAKVPTDVSATNPVPVAAFGELIETLEALRMSMQALTRTVGLSMPDASGRMRVALDAISAALTLATITTVGTVTTVTTVTTCSTLSTQTNMGGIAAKHCGDLICRRRTEIEKFST